MEVKKRVGKILEKYNICDSCLGRQFHNLYPKKSNREIGKELKSNFDYKKEKECYLCKGFFENFEEELKKVERELKKYEFDTFLVGSELPEELIRREERFWEEYGVELCEAIKTNLNREIGKGLKKKLGKEVDFEEPDVMVIVNLEEDRVIVQSSPLYVEGGYKKVLPKGKVQKIIEKSFLRESKAKDAIFYSVGRMEKNVVTSFYKPFLIKLKSPVRRKLDLRELERKINESKSVKVEGLKYSKREKVGEISGRYLVSYSIALEFGKLDGEKREEIVESLEKLRNKKIHQELKNKIRKPRISKIEARFEGKKLKLKLESTEKFSINDFLDKSKPNLKDTLGEEFKVKEIVMENCRKLKK